VVVARRETGIDLASLNSTGDRPADGLMPDGLMATAAGVDVHVDGWVETTTE
jgi:hypothetical protein